MSDEELEQEASALYATAVPVVRVMVREPIKLCGGAEAEPPTTYEVRWPDTPPGIFIARCYLLDGAQWFAQRFAEQRNKLRTPWGELDETTKNVWYGYVLAGVELP